LRTFRASTSGNSGKIVWHNLTKASGDTNEYSVKILLFFMTHRFKLMAEITQQPLLMSLPVAQ